MNEIERAIEWFTGRDKRYALSDKCAEMERIALTALREKMEREKGCEYCNSRFGIASHHVNQNGMQAGTKRNAKYCPECGKRLGVEQDEH